MNQNWVPSFFSRLGLLTRMFIKMFMWKTSHRSINSYLVAIKITRTSAILHLVAHLVSIFLTPCFSPVLVLIFPGHVPGMSGAIRVLVVRDVRVGIRRWWRAGVSVRDRGGKAIEMQQTKRIGLENSKRGIHVSKHPHRQYICIREPHVFRSLPTLNFWRFSFFVLSPVPWKVVWNVGNGVCWFLMSFHASPGPRFDASLFGAFQHVSYHGANRTQLLERVCGICCPTCHGPVCGFCCGYLQGQ